MKKKTELQNNTQLSTEESDVITLIKKMQKQLVFLEKKIDTLIENGSSKPAFGRPFNKNRFPRSDRSGGFARRGNTSDGGNFSEARGGFGRKSHSSSGERDFGRRTDGDFGNRNFSRGGGAFDKFRGGTGGQSHGNGNRKKKPFRAKKSGF